MTDTLTQPELQAIAAEPYEHRGILHSEMALILHICRRHGIEVVIESGRARGQSTYLLAKYLPEATIISVEMRDTLDEAFARQRLRGFRNVVLALGDARQALPAFAEQHAGRRTVILCDGPKGAAAVDVIEQCFRFPHVVVGFIHDMRRLDHGAPSPHRAAALVAFPDAKFSDDPHVVAGSSWMDAGIIAAGGPAGPAHEAEFGSYGPTLSVIFNG